MDPLKEIEIKNGKIISTDLPARSINTLSTYKSMHSEMARAIH
jgi:hypothetical protein